MAGSLGPHVPPSPPPDSWASRHDTDFAIWLIRLDQGATYDVPPAGEGTNRTLYCFVGEDVRVDGTAISADVGARLHPSISAKIESGDGPAEFLMLQARPIGAPVFQMGPFVMNSAEELRQAVDDYQRDRFGGWPWSRPDPVHDRSEGRFALHADGTVEHRDRQRV
jgi:redox-sensitive bicupin YhaK (pirin superfamily)